MATFGDHLFSRQNPMPAADEPSFAHVRLPESLLARAEKRLGRKVSDLSPEEKSKLFYSYFSEIGDENYESATRKLYEAYLPHLPRGIDAPFLDIGCGAGEFVGFLGQKGFKAKGIDLTPTEIARAKGHGLDCSEAEAFDYLSQTSETFSGISMIEVVEHLPFDRLQELFGLAYTRLAKGGIFLVETINIRHPLMTDGFYTDPTHQRPVPEDYVNFLMEWTGFANLKIVYTNPVKLEGVPAHDVRRIYCTYACLGQKLGGSTPPQRT